MNAEAVERFLADFRRRHDAQAVIERLRALRDQRVLVLGDVIIDEYSYCKVVGKSSKSATLTARFLNAERHAGGVLAVANHVAGFAREVDLLTFLGDPPEEETFIREHLEPNVRLHLIPQPTHPVVVKRRYVDPFQISKVFEVFWLEGGEPPTAAEDRLLAEIDRLLPDRDLVIVADFGHGAIGSRTVQHLCATEAFLAVTAQSNSANFGYNLITKYPRADYICIDEEEMRLANSDRYGGLRPLLEGTAGQLQCRYATVTRGARGSMTATRDGAVVETPVFSGEVVDSVGAGDAYLGITSLCAAADCGPDFLGFVGNCMGALAVQIVGNRRPVEPQALYSLIDQLLRGRTAP